MYAVEANLGDETAFDLPKVRIEMWGWREMILAA
jgi:hypothetical protein